MTDTPGLAHEIGGCNARQQRRCCATRIDLMRPRGVTINCARRDSRYAGGFR